MRDGASVVVFSFPLETRYRKAPDFPRKDVANRDAAVGVEAYQAVNDFGDRVFISGFGEGQDWLVGEGSAAVAGEEVELFGAGGVGGGDDEARGAGSGGRTSPVGLRE